MYLKVKSQRMLNGAKWNHMVKFTFIQNIKVYQNRSRHAFTFVSSHNKLFPYFSSLSYADECE